MKEEDKLYRLIKSNIESDIVTFVVCELPSFSDRTRDLLLSRSHNGVMSFSELDGIELTIEGLSLLKNNRRINFIIYAEDSLEYLTNFFSKKVREFFGRVSTHRDVSVTYLF